MDYFEDAAEAEEVLGERQLILDTSKNKQTRSYSTTKPTSRYHEETISTVPVEEEDNDDYRVNSCVKINLLMAIMAITFLSFAATLAPKLNLVFKAVCAEHTEGLVSGSEPSSECRASPEVHKVVTQFNLYAGVISGLLGAVCCPKWAKLSDRYGRRPVMIGSALVTIFGYSSVIVVSSFPDLFSYKWFLISSVCDGVGGGLLLMLALSHSYIADLIRPSKLAASFGRMDGISYTGMAVGPALGGILVKYTHSLISVFWISILGETILTLSVLFLLTESLHPREKALARDRYASECLRFQQLTWLERAKSISSIWKPLAILRPHVPDKIRGKVESVDDTSYRRRNLTVLGIMDCITMIIAIGSSMTTVMYAELRFNMTSSGVGMFISVMSCSRVIFLILLFPLVTKAIHSLPRFSRKVTLGLDFAEVTLVRISCFWYAVIMVLYANAASLAQLFSFAVLSAGTAMEGPSIRASVLRCAPEGRSGEITGALACLQALARILAPVIFLSIYGATVGTHPTTFFYVIGIVYLFSFSISFLLGKHTNAYSDQDDTTTTTTTAGDIVPV